MSNNLQFSTDPIFELKDFIYSAGSLPHICPE